MMYVAIRKKTEHLVSDVWYCGGFVLGWEVSVTLEEDSRGVMPTKLEEEGMSFVYDTIHSVHSLQIKSENPTDCSIFGIYQIIVIPIQCQDCTLCRGTPWGPIHGEAVPAYLAPCIRPSIMSLHPGSAWVQGPARPRPDVTFYFLYIYTDLVCILPTLLPEI